MSDYDWEPFKGDTDYIKFENVGDETIGEITYIGVGKDFNQLPCPLLKIVDNDGDERTLTAGQVMLKSALAEAAPQVGDRIRIVYSGVGEAKPGKAPAKLFKVAVQTGAGNVDPTVVKKTAKPAPVPDDEVPF